jgi:hypothetical protein
MLMEGDVAMEAETAFSMDFSVGYEELGDAGGAEERVRSQCRCWGMGVGDGTQQSNGDDENQRHRRTGGIVAGGCEVDTPEK